MTGGTPRPYSVQPPQTGMERTPIKAYVLIVTDPGNTQHVLEQIRGMQGLEAVHEVMGPYDIVVEISADNLQDVPRVLRDRIRPIEGVQSTISLVTFPD